jgi:hypothetical protein
MSPPTKIVDAMAFIVAGMKRRRALALLMSFALPSMSLSQTPQAPRAMQRLRSWPIALRNSSAHTSPMSFGLGER